MKLYGLLAAMTVSMMVTGWTSAAFIIDLLGYNYLDPRKHFNVPEFIWALIFGALAYYFFYQARKLKGKKKTHGKKS